MKILLRSIFCITLLCTFFTQLHAQDFVVTSTNDTIRGEIEKEIFGFYRFKPQGSDNSIKIKRQEIKEFYKAEKEVNFLVRQIPWKRRPEFLERIIKGKIDLFEYGSYGGGAYHPGAPGGAGSFSGSGMSIIEWYACKSNGELFEVKSTSFFGSRRERKENFYKLISDKPELLEKFMKNDDYSLEAIEACIKEYNSN
ncbi:hypothetical protein DHW03_05460 [Pedobacter yonginense]|uniref:GLPGLI family protein n=1 Tax=Pedobacter yonginense TaxID=651869 RepID=A0A317ET71_9SPHI|nr:hypothetical protein [Pedobacter yonginense]PWS29267.1 hypothetical protein DHW03_05460 [Pedobacter yonginense]